VKNRKNSNRGVLCCERLSGKGSVRRGDHSKSRTFMDVSTEANGA